MTYPKMKFCPNCQIPVACYTYESGWSRVECDRCSYIGSCEGRKIDAIRVHNAHVAALATPQAPAQTEGDKPLTEERVEDLGGRGT